MCCWELVAWIVLHDYSFVFPAVRLCMFVIYKNHKISAASLRTLHSSIIWLCIVSLCTCIIDSVSELQCWVMFVPDCAVLMLDLMSTIFHLMSSGLILNTLMANGNNTILKLTDILLTSPTHDHSQLNVSSVRRLNRLRLQCWHRCKFSHLRSLYNEYRARKHIYNFLNLCFFAGYEGRIKNFYILRW